MCSDSSRGLIGRAILMLALAVTVQLAANGCMTALLLNDAHHMTVERATTPRLPTRFRVLDAETAQPVPGAQIVAMHNFDWMSDWFVRGTTDAAGVATLRLAKPHVDGMDVHVYADGYLDRHYLTLGESPGTGRLGDDPLDILVYREPPAGVGWRLPEDFRGTVVAGSSARQDFGETVLISSEPPADEPFRTPPAFPPGQRIWWSDVEPGRVNRVNGAPRLGDSGRDTYPIPDAVTVGGRPVPIPEPGADVNGVALWHVGANYPDGPWGGVYAIIVIGDRADAIAKARALFDEHGNGEGGFIFNGWLRIVSPRTKLQTSGAYAVTRPSLAR